MPAYSETALIGDLKMCKKDLTDDNRDELCISSPMKTSNATSYMEEEILEQVKSFQRAIHGRVDFQCQNVKLKEVEPYLQDILRCRRLILIGAASSYHIAVATRQILEELVELPVFVESASDFVDREVPIFRNDVCIFISQSGYTRSITEACKYCRKRDALIMAVTNCANSTLVNMADLCVDIKAGNEVGVASTKSYCNAFITMVLIGLYLSRDKKTKLERRREIISELQNFSNKINKVLKQNKSIKILAEKMKESNSILVMGRGFQRGTCLEGALKLKEITNKHSEGIHSGELKHGPLALIDESIPIIMIIMRDAVYDKCINALEQIRARRGSPVVICDEQNIELSKMANDRIKIPSTVDCLAGILTIIPLQLLALYIGRNSGKDVDNPNALLKVVTETV